MLKALYIINAEREARGTLRTPFRFYLCRQNKAAAPKALHGAAKTGKKQAFLMQNCRKKIKSLKSY